tara:strand:+ start:192 stop:449 length:258 start_codon:yes stop_codon:yes gene_type:complete
MEGVNSIFAVLAVLGASALAFFLGRGCIKKKKGSTETPPENRAASAARDTIQQTFKEEVEKVWADAQGEDPAGDLADRGNARRRK